MIVRSLEMQHEIDVSSLFSVTLFFYKFTHLQHRDGVFSPFFKHLELLTVAFPTWTFLRSDIFTSQF